MQNDFEYIWDNTELEKRKIGDDMMSTYIIAFVLHLIDDKLPTKKFFTEIKKNETLNNYINDESINKTKLFRKVAVMSFAKKIYELYFENHPRAVKHVVFLKRNKKKRLKKLK